MILFYFLSFLFSFIDFFSFLFFIDLFPSHLHLSSSFPTFSFSFLLLISTGLFFKNYCLILSFFVLNFFFRFLLFVTLKWRRVYCFFSSKFFSIFFFSSFSSFFHHRSYFFIHSFSFHPLHLSFLVSNNLRFFFVFHSSFFFSIFLFLFLNKIFSFFFFYLCFFFLSFSSTPSSPVRSLNSGSSNTFILYSLIIDLSSVRPTFSPSQTP